MPPKKSHKTTDDASKQQASSSADNPSKGSVQTRSTMRDLGNQPGSSNQPAAATSEHHDQLMPQSKGPDTARSTTMSSPFEIDISAGEAERSPAHDNAQIAPERSEARRPIMFNTLYNPGRQRQHRI